MAARPVARLPMAAALGVAALLLALPGQAEEEDRALGSLGGPVPLAARAPTQEEHLRESQLRGGGLFGTRHPGAGDRALLAAMRAGRWTDALKLLTSGQADANARDEVGGHPLVLAARAGQDELLRELLRRGTDTQRRGEDGFTALGAAAFAGHRSTVRLLLRAGVDATRWGVTGQTALHLASIAGHVEVIDEMLRAAVAVDMLNRQRETALDVAANGGQQAVMERLIQAGANLDQAGRR